MRRVIVVNGAHLNGKFRVLMLVAACQDENRGIYPIAFRVVKAKDAASWEWFFTQLRGVILDGKDLAFISDRCPAIAKALTNVLKLIRAYVYITLDKTWPKDSKRPH